MKKIFVILSVFFLFSYIVSSKEEEYKDLGYNYYYVKKDNIKLSLSDGTINALVISKEKN